MTNLFELVTLMVGPIPPAYNLGGRLSKNTGETGHRYNFGANPCVCFSRAKERAESVRAEKSNIPTEKIQ